jgi:FtsH-binding integral membrane protein
MSDTTIDPTTVTGLGSTDAARTVFSQTMGLVAVTAGLFALGAYVGRDLTQGWAWVFFIAAFASLIAMRYAARRQNTSEVGLLFVFGLLIGLATAPTVAFYARTNPQAVWEAGGATALFITALGAAGYGSRRDLSTVARVSSWALVGLIVCGIVVIFVQIPNGSLIYSVLGLVIFAGLTVVDFRRLRQVDDASSAPLLAASIFLDALNVFLFFLTIFDNDR